MTIALLSIASSHYTNHTIAIDLNLHCTHYIQKQNTEEAKKQQSKAKKSAISDRQTNKTLVHSFDISYRKIKGKSEKTTTDKHKCRLKIKKGQSTLTEKM